MNKEDMILDILKSCSEKLDRLAETTAGQEERIKQNTKELDLQRKKTWAIAGTTLTAFISAIASKFFM